MQKRVLTLAAAVLSAGLTMGCHDDKPHEYGEERPPIDQLGEGDRGLQSKDVVSASDQMTMDLLALPELHASDHRWLIVIDHVDNLSNDRRADYDIFLERLRVGLAKQGRGRVQLIENRDKLRQLQSNELEPGVGPDTYGQGSGGKPAPGPAGIQPDYSLYGKIMELPNRAHSYYQFEFTLTDLHTRQQVWTNDYEVNVRR